MKEFLKTEVKKICLREPAENTCGCAVAVGGFDGVHLGHRAMITRLVSVSKERGLTSAVFTFDTDDSPKSGARLLAQQEKKYEILASLGVDTVYSVAFSLLKDVSASDFACGLLYDALDARVVVCGYDFRFGRDRVGDVSLINSLLGDKGVTVVTPDAELCNGEPISSTKIRRLISEGEVASANVLLGREFSFSAEVVRGRRLGRTLGFPTINQKYPDTLASLRYGVYAVVCVIDGIEYGGVANVGVKPTVGEEESPICETHIFGYSGDCYGVSVETRFVGFIRDEKRFLSLEELKAQVENDKLNAVNLLNARRNCI